MIVKLETGGYYDINTGRELITIADGVKWKVVIRNASHTTERAVCVGYYDKAEAQAALDELMTNVDVLYIALPEPTEVAIEGPAETEASK